MAENNILTTLTKIDDIFRNSPTAQTLSAYAPQILAYFNEARAMSAQRSAELAQLMACRDRQLEKFREMAPTYQTEITNISQEIRTLQAIVRDKAATLSSDPNAKVVIDYTNRQISDLINMYNNLTYHLLYS